MCGATVNGHTPHNGSKEQRPKPSETVAWSQSAFNINNPSFRALNALPVETLVEVTARSLPGGGLFV